MDQFIDTPGPSGTSQALDLTESQPLDLTSGSLAPEQPKKRRRGMTEADRRALRRHKQSHPKATYTDLIKWFQDEFHHKINQSTVSFSLSTQFDYLDTDIRKDTSLTGRRSSQSDWPDLESVLFEWQQKMQQQKAIITGDILKQKAYEIWHLLPQYCEQPEPKWSNGWLTNFKNRFHIKEYVYHGEGGTADIESPENIKQMQENRDLAATYPPENVLNMDKTGLYWKMSPNRTLATEASNGGKRSKERITLALTVNATGTDKWEPWLIGKSENPRCFKHVNRRLLGVQYRYNNSKWMTGVICAEYLHWLNRKCSAQGRHVLLFMDNFSGHEYGVDLVGGKQALSHVRVEWLPPNTTSHWQPADQGIINTFKLHYRKQWVGYMIKQFEANKDPNKTVTLLHAINWTVYAWNNHVKASTIANCWYKSSLIAKPLLGGDLDAHSELDEEWAAQ